MKQSKIIINSEVLDRVVGSSVASESEQLMILKYIGYLTYSEQKELCGLL